MTTRKLFVSLLIALSFMLTLAVCAQPAADAPVAEPPLRDLTASGESDAAPIAPEATPAVPATPETAPKKPKRPRSHAPRASSSDQAVVSIGSDAHHAAGAATQAVVTIAGSSTVDGPVNDAVVAIWGDTRVEGSVGDAVVTVFGNSYINSEVQQVVAVMGGVELGPKAVVHDQIVTIGGRVVRNEGAVVSSLHEVRFLSSLPRFDGLRAWMKEAVFLGRPLALQPHLEWAWVVALLFLGFYVLLGLSVPGAVTKGADTLTRHPGKTLLAAVISTVLTPLLIVLLAVTGVGPFILLVLGFFAVLFGKTVILAVVGGALIRPERDSRAGLVGSILLGGGIFLALYLVPVLGFLLFFASSILAVGIVVYTLLGASRSAGGVPPTPPVPPVGAPIAPSPVISTGTVAPQAANLGVASVSADPVPPAVTSGEPAVETPRSEATPPVAPFGTETGAFTNPSPVPPVPPTGTPSSFHPLPPPLASAALPRAGFWIRTGALLIDFLLIGVVTGVAGLSSVLFILLASYAAVMWRYKATTIGGVICNLRVVRMDDRPLDWTTAVVRALGCFVSLFVAGLGFIWVAFDRDRQSWHDKIAGTTVVRVPPGTSLL